MFKCCFISSDLRLPTCFISPGRGARRQSDTVQYVQYSGTRLKPRTCEHPRDTHGGRSWRDLRSVLEYFLPIVPHLISTRDGELESMPQVTSERLEEKDDGAGQTERGQ